MSRRAVIKRAKIRRTRKLVALAWFKEIMSQKIMELLSTYRPITYEIAVQPVSEMRDQEKADQCAPRIDVTICRSKLP